MRELRDDQRFEPARQAAQAGEGAFADGSASVQAHFVTYYSPGTFVSEQTEKPVDSWDVEAAVEMAKTVLERHGATPHSFRFSTRSRGPSDLDSRVSDRSPLYWLGGTIETLDDVEARNDPSEEILRANMRGNGVKRVIVNTNSWRFTSAFSDGDVLLPFAPPPLRPRRMKDDERHPAGQTTRS